MDQVASELVLTLRLVIAAGMGAAIGLERELASHPAGMRTHLLVSLGSALFALVSAYGYADVFASDPEALSNPQRIAAQIVSGIGFLGAGAIIQAGRWVRGLTTAASLWAAAAVGLAVGSGEYILGLAGTGLIVFSLGPLNWAVDRWRGKRSRFLRLRVELSTLSRLGRVTEMALVGGVDVAGLETRKLGKGKYEVDLVLRLTGRRGASEIVSLIGDMDGVEVTDASDASE